MLLRFKTLAYILYINAVWFSDAIIRDSAFNIWCQTQKIKRRKNLLKCPGETECLGKQRTARITFWINFHLKRTQMYTQKNLALDLNFWYQFNFYQNTQTAFRNWKSKYAHRIFIWFFFCSMNISKISHRIFIFIFIFLSPGYRVSNCCSKLSGLLTGILSWHRYSLSEILISRMNG